MTERNKLKRVLRRQAEMREQMQLSSNIEKRYGSDAPVRGSSGFVYFIQAAQSKMIKIGFTRNENITHRMQDLQVGSPEKLAVLTWMKGEISDEQELHNRFAAHWSHGEWFFPGADLLAFVAELQAPLIRPPLESIALKFGAKPTE